MVEFQENTQTRPDRDSAPRREQEEPRDRHYEVVIPQPRERRSVVEAKVQQVERNNDGGTQQIEPTDRGNSPQSEVAPTRETVQSGAQRSDPNNPPPRLPVGATAETVEQPNIQARPVEQPNIGQSLPTPAPAPAPPAAEPLAVPPPKPIEPAPKAGEPGNAYKGMASDPIYGGKGSVGSSPRLTPEAKAKLSTIVQGYVDPEASIDLETSHPRVLILKRPPFRVQIGDENLLGVNVISPREILLQGKNVGTTILNIWFGDPNDMKKQETMSFEVRVFPDKGAKERLEKAYKTLADDINKEFPDARIKLKILGDKLVVSGRVRDYVQGGKILQIIRASDSNMRNNNETGGRAGLPGGGDYGKLPLVPTGAINDPTGGANPPSASDFQVAGGPNVINLLEVAGEQQVSLRVVVAEVNRAAARSIGMNFSVRDSNGISRFSNNSGPVTGGFGSAIGQGLGNFGGATANILFDVSSGRVPIALNALKNLQYSRSLAEPTLVAINGQTATFQSGGSFPVPVIGGNGTFGNQGGGLQGVQYVPFGVQLSFTPLITDRDRIRLQLNANISTRDLNASTSIGGGQVAGLNTRNVATTVELRQGETIAVAGLIETNIGADTTRVPFLSDVPFLAPLTGLNRVQSGEKELVIFLTPELTRPLDPNCAGRDVLKLPGHEILDPTDLEFYGMGRIEGHCRDFRTPIRTDLSRVRQYLTIDNANIAGPVGYSTLP